MDRISICDYKRNEKTPFLKQVMMGKEKWIIYNNVERNESPLAPKAGLHPKKIILCLVGLERDPILAFTTQTTIR